MEIFVNDRRRQRGVKHRELIPYLEWTVNDLVVQTQDAERCALVHAAVVARDDDGVLICGKSGCGKSSLSLALMQRGYRYLTDEIACWNATEDVILAYPKAITLKEYGYRRFQRARIPLPQMLRYEAFGEKLWYIPPKPRSIQSSAAVRLIVFPVFQAGRAMKLRSLSKGRAITWLHRQRFDGDGFGREDFEVLAGLVKQAPAFQLSYEDVFEAAAVIDDLLGKRGCA